MAVKHNAIIFNWVDGYEDKVKHLVKTMEELQNHVRVYNHLNYNELIKVVEELRNFKFDELHKYLAIIVLDNKCKHKRFIQTSDGKEVLLDTQILTVIQTNKYLADKPRLFLTQKLVDWSEYDDDDNANSRKVLKKSTEISNDPYYREIYNPIEEELIINGTKFKKIKSKILYQGLKVTIDAEEKSDNFQQSPFIDTFCEIFKANANTMDIIKICNIVRDEIRKNPKFKDYHILIGSNQKTEDSLIFGSALTSDEIRDFF